MREMGLAVILPLDRHIYFHKVTGRLIVIYSIIHTGAHLGNLCEKLIFFIKKTSDGSRFWIHITRNLLVLKQVE